MLKNYLKITFAVLLRRKFYTIVSLLGIVFTITVLLIASTILDHTVGEVPPEQYHERTLGIFRVSYQELNSDGEARTTISSSGSFHFLSELFEDLPGAEMATIVKNTGSYQTYINGQRVKYDVKFTDTEFWSFFNFTFLEGRAFTADEYESGASVVVINRDLRERLFGDEPGLNRDVEMDGVSYRVVGVIENVSSLRNIAYSEVWAPITSQVNFDRPDEITGNYKGLILAENRSSFPLIREEFVARIPRFEEPRNGRDVNITCFPETRFQYMARETFGNNYEEGDYSLLLWLMIFGIGLLFMLLPAINLVNLNISRIYERCDEIGIRKAFGAPSTTLVGQFITENIVFTFAGGLLSLIISYLSLLLLQSSDIIPYAEFHLNWRVFFYALLASFVFGLVSGVYPAWRMSKLHPVEALRGGVV